MPISMSVFRAWEKKLHAGAENIDHFAQIMDMGWKEERESPGEMYKVACPRS